MDTLELLASGAFSAKPSKPEDGGERKKTKMKRKRQSKPEESFGFSSEALPWKQMDLEEYKLEGFEDGTMLSLEVLDGNSYELIRDEARGTIMRPKETSRGHTLVDKEISKAPTSAYISSKQEKDKEESPALKEQKQPSHVDDKGDKNEAINSSPALSKKEKRKERKKKSRETPKESPTTEESPLKTEQKEENNTGLDVATAAVSVKKWRKYPLHKHILSTLSRLGFSSPTLIQEKTLPAALLEKKDILGIAETGSGKTLAYGLPILDYLLRSADDRQGQRRQGNVEALILTPTRELAMQVQQHLHEFIKGSPIRAVSIVGGMSQEKQERLLSYSPEIVIGTPGRLWELIQSHRLFSTLSSSLRFLVLDEADRMLEPGHFPELNKIFEVLGKSNKQMATKPKEVVQKLEVVKTRSENSKQEEGEDEEDMDDMMGLEPAAAPVQMLTDDILAQIEEQKKLPAVRYEDSDSDGEGVENGEKNGENESSADSVNDQDSDGLPQDDEDADITDLNDEGKPESDSYRSEDEEELGEKTQEDVVLHGSASSEAELDEAEETVIRQTFLFSATLSLGDEARFKKGKKWKKKKAKSINLIQSAITRVGLRGKPVVVDLTRGTHEEGEQKLVAQGKSKVSLPAGLRLCELECLEEERDVYLYYFLLQGFHKFLWLFFVVHNLQPITPSQYPGRTIVFANAISAVKRLATLLSTLELPVVGLHANMQQRQRLKKLDRFKGDDKTILVATDVAARGLDISNVRYIVHYHAPKAADTFIHRSGRTARAAAEGLSLSLVTPNEKRTQMQICNIVSGTDAFETFPVDLRFLPPVRDRMQCAVIIEKHQTQTSKKRSNSNWFLEQAKAADLLLDEELLEKFKPDSASLEVTRAETRLKLMLAQPLRPTGSKRKFVDARTAMGELNETLEFRARDAKEDLNKKKKRKQQ